jgi:DUF2075 family protein/phage repressor protein C with HTH and peptisase S24 domain
MIIYKNTSEGFLADVNGNKIVDLIQEAFKQQVGWFPTNEVSSWNNSMQFMESIIRNSKLCKDCGILIEYKIPLTSNRIDFIIAGSDNQHSRNFIIVELKQWESAQATSMDGIVVTFLGGKNRETTHPSYQANSYKCLLSDYNENIEKKNINLHSCAYLHNYKESQPEPLLSDVYSEIVADTPMFFKHDTEKLQSFISKHVGCGKGMDVLYDIQFGSIRPSKKLVDHVCGMFAGNKSFVLIDNQKVAFEKAMSIARNADEKTVLIVKGGPGTGKSVISMNLLGSLLREKHNVIFVAPNASFRDVMLEMLAREHRKNRLKHLFKGSAAFVDAGTNVFDAIIVDEAHRLKNGTAYQYKGDNQLVDIIKSSKTSILFIDENQRIRPEDIGTVAEIKRVAKTEGAKFYEIELEAQFRCAGAEGFLNWLDHILHIKKTANFDGWDRKDFEFVIFDDPNEMRKAIKAKNADGYTARMLAGYAWKWSSEKEGNPNSEIEDVTIPAYNFAMPWNSRKARTTWAIDKTGVDQIGCIHTSQGLEFDYVGVIVGDDLKFDPDSMSYYIDWNAYRDSTGKKGLKKDLQALSILVRNIYKTLMSRAMRGCYVYICNSSVRKLFSDSLARMQADNYAESLKDVEVTRPQIEYDIDDNFQYKEYLPVYSFAAACGHFGNGESVQITGWIKAGSVGRIGRNMFVVQARGSSMEPLIPNKALCVFRAPVIGTRQNKIVLVQHTDYSDPEYGGAYSIKKYTSRKTFAKDGTWQHEEIVLEPLNKEYTPIVIKENDSDSHTVIAEFVKIIGGR